MSYRNTRENDFPLIGEAILRTLLTAPKYGYIHEPNVDKAVADIYNKHLIGDTYIVDNNYLLIVESITPWYSNDKILEEVLVLGLSNKGNIKQILIALEDIAIDRCDTTIALSDSSIGLRLSPVYERHGYTKITNKFIRRLPHG